MIMPVPRRVRSFAPVVALLLLLALGLPSHSVQAQAAFQVVASNLDNPRGLAFGPDGALYVAEAGRGGSGSCIPAPEGDGEVCPGTSGAVTRVLNGQQTRILTGLPSIAAPDGSAAVGSVDVAVRSNGELFVIVGLGAPPEARALMGSIGASFGQLVRMTAPGQVQHVADLTAYEASANPDGGVVDSNPYSLVALPDRWVIVDAGGNDLLEVAADGSISTLAVFPGRVVPAPPIPNLPPELPMDAVPDAVALGPDGAFYVSELTGFPFPVGGARVYRVVPGQAPTVYAEGFTNIIDLAFGPDGSLYVLELASKGLLQAMQPDGDFTGALIRVGRDGARATIASEGLIAPGGLAVGPDGALYVSNFSVMPGMGQVVRIAAPGAGLPNTGVAAAPVFFPETGYVMEGDLLDYWRSNGGLAVFGFPIDSARQTNGQVAQWLERARFELHPANAAPYNVLLGRIGVEALERQGRDWRQFAKASPSVAHYFAETGHAIAPEFWSYWRNHGLEFGDAGVSMRESLALFGYPISAAQMETNSSGDRVMTQWFERARFEYHPDNPSAYQVLLGRLGAEVRAAERP